MDFLIEELIELLLEGTVELSKSKKVPNWIRYPLIVLIVLGFTGVVLGIFILGLAILKESILGGILLIVLSLVFLVCGICKFRKTYIERQEK